MAVLALLTIFFYRGYQIKKIEEELSSFESIDIAMSAEKSEKLEKLILKMLEHPYVITDLIKYCNNDDVYDHNIKGLIASALASINLKNPLVTPELKEELFKFYKNVLKSGIKNFSDAKNDLIRKNIASLISFSYERGEKEYEPLVDIMLPPNEETLWFYGIQALCRSNKDKLLSVIIKNKKSKDFLLEVRKTLEMRAPKNKILLEKVNELLGKMKNEKERNF